MYLAVSIYRGDFCPPKNCYKCFWILFVLSGLCPSKCLKTHSYANLFSCRFWLLVQNLLEIQGWNILHIQWNIMQYTIFVTFLSVIPGFWPLLNDWCLAFSRMQLVKLKCWHCYKCHGRVVITNNEKVTYRMNTKPLSIKAGMMTCPIKSIMHDFVWERWESDWFQGSFSAIKWTLEMFSSSYSCMLGFCTLK